MFVFKPGDFNIGDYLCFEEAGILFGVEVVDKDQEHIVLQWSDMHIGDAVRYRYFGELPEITFINKIDKTLYEIFRTLGDESC